jgi:outer membrane protein
VGFAFNFDLFLKRAAVGGLGFLALAFATVAQDAQTPPSAEAATLHTDSRTPGPWFLVPFHGLQVKASRSTNSDRVAELLRSGILYLSLDDAIDLAIENNFDVEIQRFDHEFALTDIMRSEGGGLLRGVPTTVSELPAGEGGPGEPIVTTVAGYSPVIQLPSSAADLATITGSSTDLSVLGPTALSDGPPIPQFDPTLNGQVAVQQMITPTAFPLTTGSNIERTHGLLVNLGYQQGFSPGTQLTVTDYSDATNSNATTANLNPSKSGYLGVSLVQPLLQGFGIRVNRRFIRIAKNNEKIADYVFRQQLISTVSDTIRLYWDLVSLTADLTVKEESLKASQRLYEDTKHQVEQGTQAPLQLTSAQAQLESSRQDYINSQGLVLQQELLLKELLTRKGISDPAIANARIEALTTIVPPGVDTLDSLPTLLNEAIQSRPDLSVAQLELENTRISLEGSRNALLPQLNLTASIENNGLAGSANSAAGPTVIPAPSNFIGGYGTMEQQIFNRDYPSYSVGVQLNIPIRNRVARADYARDELQLRATQVRIDQLDSQVRLQVGNAQIALQQAGSAYEAAVEARNLQAQALEVEQARFDEGVDTAYDLIQYQRDLAQAESAEVSALGVYAKAKAAVQRAAGLTLRDYNVSIGDAYDGKLPQASTEPPAK